MGSILETAIGPIQTLRSRSLGGQFSKVKVSGSGPRIFSILVIQRLLPTKTSHSNGTHRPGRVEHLLQ